jgi:hypothetical protein
MQGGTGSMAASSRTASADGNSAPRGNDDEIDYGYDDDYDPAHDGRGGSRLPALQPRRRRHGFRTGCGPG